MEFRIFEDRLSKLSARFNLMVCLTFGLLISNTSLSLLIWNFVKEKQIEIVPYADTSGYIKSSSQVDSTYLRLMSENFIYSRLNVTPETVDLNHKKLLNFINEKNYVPIINQLTKEREIIKNKKITSVFEIANLKIIPNSLEAEVSGALKQYVGTLALEDKKVTYVLKFSYQLGRLSILSFSTKEKVNA